MINMALAEIKVVELIADRDRLQDKSDKDDDLLADAGILNEKLADKLRSARKQIANRVKAVEARDQEVARLRRLLHEMVQDDDDDKSAPWYPHCGRLV